MSTRFLIHGIPIVCLERLTKRAANFSSRGPSRPETPFNLVLLGALISVELAGAGSWRVAAPEPDPCNLSRVPAPRQPMLSAVCTGPCGNSHHHHHGEEVGQGPACRCLRRSDPVGLDIVLLQGSDIEGQCLRRDEDDGGAENRVQVGFLHGYKEIVAHRGHDYAEACAIAAWR